MPLRSASFCTLLLLAGCAAHTEQPAPKVQVAPPAGVPGTILAMRPVRAEAPEPARILLSGLGTGTWGAPAAGAAGGDNIFEFIVRTESGTTISVVQPRANGLHPGERISILRGVQTRIDAPPTD
jgi:outer membrane lipoprotein SlyB